jgi:hypothetical protein
MTWNSNSLLSGSRELAFSNLLKNNNIDVLVVTETEIPALSAPFATTGYFTFFFARQREGEDAHDHADQVQPGDTGKRLHPHQPDGLDCVPIGLGHG